MFNITYSIFPCSDWCWAERVTGMCLHYCSVLSSCSSSSYMNRIMPFQCPFRLLSLDPFVNCFSLKNETVYIIDILKICYLHGGSCRHECFIIIYDLGLAIHSKLFLCDLSHGKRACASTDGKWSPLSIETSDTRGNTGALLALNKGVGINKCLQTKF